MRFFWNIEVDPRTVPSALLVELTVSVFHNVDAGFHIQDLLDMLVGEKDHRGAPN